MTTFTWKINQLERNVADGGVVIAHYSITAEDGEFNQGAYGTQNFEPDPNADDFVAFDDLTEENVIEWVKSAFGAEKVQQIEDALTAKIEEKKSPTVVAGTPWS